MAKIKITPEIMAEAFRQTEVKTKLAVKLERKLKSWNLFMRKEFVKDVKRGDFSDAVSNEAVIKLQDILNSHYKKVAKAFTLKVRSRKIEVTTVKDKIKSLTESLIQSNARKRLKNIIDTTRNDKKRAIEAGTQAILDQINRDGAGKITNKLLARVAGRIFLKKLDGRLKTRGISETNWIAEGTRSIHVSTVKPAAASLLDNLAEKYRQIINASKVVLDEFSEEFIDRALETLDDYSQLTYSETVKTGSRKITKEVSLNSARAVERLAKKIKEQLKAWITMSDNKVRQSHRNANGQTVPDSQPFSVGESLLMYADDPSLGAEVKELAN
jgi:hypothetical protein